MLRGFTFSRFGVDLFGGDVYSYKLEANEVLSIVDFSVSIIRGKMFIEQVFVGDDKTKRDFIKGLSDNVLMNDSRQFSSLKMIMDMMNVSNDHVRKFVRNLVREFVDILDNTSRKTERNFEDVFKVVDAMSKTNTLLRVLSESVSVTDYSKNSIRLSKDEILGAVEERRFDVSMFFTDNIRTVDKSRKFSYFIRVDSLGFSDSVNLQPGKLSKIVFSMNEIRNRFEVSKTLMDVVNVIDIIRSGIIKFLAENVILNDMKNFSVMKVSVDSVFASDAVKRLVLKDIADIIDAWDNTSKDIVTSVIEYVGLDDVLGKSVGVLKLEKLSLVDSLNKLINLSEEEYMLLLDALSRSSEKEILEFIKYSDLDVDTLRDFIRLVLYLSSFIVDVIELNSDININAEHV